MFYSSFLDGAKGKSPKMKKIHNFLDHPLPQDNLDCFKFGPNLGKFEIGKILKFGSLTRGKNKYKFKTLKDA